MSKREKKVTKKDCAGCRNDFYNGHNDLGVSECWSLKDAVMKLRREVHINDMPPHRQKPALRPNCYHRSQFVYYDVKAKR